MNKNFERALILLKATDELLKKQENSSYVLDILGETTFYDGSECDGACLLEDIGELLDSLDNSMK
jgi:hypothetical protein